MDIYDVGEGIEDDDPPYEECTIDDLFGMGEGDFEDTVPDNHYLKADPVGPVYSQHLEYIGLDLIKPMVSPVDEIQKKRRKRRKNVSQIKHAMEEMKFKDHLVVDELEKSLHPELLEMVRTMLVPNRAEDLDDGLNAQNQLRTAILQQLMNTDGKPGKRAYMDDVDVVGDSLYVNGEVVMEGGQPVDIMEYVLCMYPRCSYKVFRALQNQMSRYEQRNCWNMDTYSELLKYHRAGRRLSKSMNKITKVSQLEKLDQDNPYNWFGETEIPEEYSLYGINMDPRISFRYPHIKMINGLEEVDTEDYCVILANLVIGDEVGGFGNNLKLLENLERFKVGKQDVMIGVLLYSGQIAKGNYEVVNIPRPHNMIVAAFLDENYSDFEYVNKAAMLANQRRSERYFKTCMVEKLKNKNRWIELDGMLYRAKIKIKEILNAYDFRKQVKIKKRQVERPNALEVRKREIMKLAMDPKFEFGEKYYKVQPFMIRNGDALFNQVAYVGNSIMAMNSVRKYVLQNRGTVEFYNGQWRMYRK